MPQMYESDLSSYKMIQWEWQREIQTLLVAKQFGMPLAQLILSSYIPTFLFQL